MTYGLIGSLYQILKEKSVFKKQTDYVDFLWDRNNSNEDITLNDVTCSSIIKYDYFIKDLLTYSQMHVENQKAFMDKLAFQLKHLSPIARSEMNNRLSSIVENVSTYATRRNPQKDNGLLAYDEDYKAQLLNYYKYHQDNQVGDQNLEYNMYLMFYFGINKSLPANFFFGQHYREALQEFNDEILCKYGVLSNPGIRALTELAFRKDKKKNVFALNEYADIMYYGRTDSHIPDYEKAIEYYRAAAGLNNLDNVDETACHPLALSSLSYIYLNYHRDGHLKNIKNIPRLDALTQQERIECALHYARASLSFIKTGYATNIMGNISNVLDDTTRLKYRLQEPRFYYEQAAKLNYVYAYNNLATLASRAINTDRKNASSLIEEYVKKLTIAAELFDPWAANTLGLFYLNGELKYCKHTFPDVIDLAKAKHYFECAVSTYIDVNSAWAAANLMVSFPESYPANTPETERLEEICINMNNQGANSHLLKNAHKWSDKYCNEPVSVLCATM